ncbi:unnamed protein product [Rotaria sordida]|uniref:Uncharacterized protein n=1 Tax=Rotaria sordida TaxID=392033 RepID=A0A819BXP2_9BILA|nr:unnamed protein product [Rotaria sordida]
MPYDLTGTPCNIMLMMRIRNETIVDSHISVDLIHRRKEQLKREIQEIREKIAQCEVEMSIIQSHNTTNHT